MKLYPLQFNPILKERIWGGTKLKTYLNKPITSETNNFPRQFLELIRFATQKLNQYCSYPVNFYD